MNDVDGDGRKLHFYLRSSGQYYDGESGMHHNYWRDYDPEIGRYLQSSSVGVDAGLNSYQFSHASPIMNTQRLGQAVDLRTSCAGFNEALPGIYQTPKLSEALTSDQSLGFDWLNKTTNR
jgi:RHS repeat-associated protein